MRRHTSAKSDSFDTNPGTPQTSKRRDSLHHFRRMGGQFIWPLANYDQLQVLSNVPKLTSLLSILGSCYIIFDICRLEKRNTYHRIIFGMNVMDLMALVAWFFTTWPMPEGTVGAVGATGNQGTCSAQGFFSQLSIATVLYNACLSIYFMLVIKWGWTEQRIQKAKLEYYFHAVCLTVGVGTAAMALIFGLYNPAGWQCWITAAPVGCTESWEMEDNDDIGGRFLRFLNGESNSTSLAENHSTTTGEALYPCTRGDNATLFQYFFFFLPLWACIIVATICLYQVYSAFKKQDQVTAKWKQKLMYATAAPSKVIRKTTKATTRMASKATSKTFKYTSKSVRSLMTQGTRTRPTPSKKAKYTPAQKRKLEMEEGRCSECNKDISEPSANRENMYSMDASQESVDGLIRDVNNQSNPSRLSEAPTKSLPPLLRTRHPPKVMEALSQLKKKTAKLSNEEKKKLKKPKKVHSAKSKLVTSQALLYLVSFYAAWLFPTVTRIQISVTKEGIAYYHWVLLAAFFVPLQGLMNFVVYIRPKVLAIRREKKRLAALKKRQEEYNATMMAFQKPSTVGTSNGGIGSSSHLMATASISNEDTHADNNDETGGRVGHDGDFQSEENHDSPDNTDGVTAPCSLALPENTLHQLNGGGPSDMRKSTMDNNTNIHNTSDEEASINQDDAMAELFGALNNSSHQRRNDTRSVPIKSHSSTSNLLHMRQIGEEIKASKKLMDQFNRSVCLDAQGHVLTSNISGSSGPDTQETTRSNSLSVYQDRKPGWRALKSSVTGDRRRSASSISAADNRQNSALIHSEPGSSSMMSTSDFIEGDSGVSLSHIDSNGSGLMKNTSMLDSDSFTNMSSTDLLPGDPEPRISNGSNLILKSDDCILDSGGFTDDDDDESEHFQQPSQDLAFSSYQSLPFNREPHIEHEAFRSRPSNVHALSQPAIKCREDRTICRSNTDPIDSENKQKSRTSRGSKNGSVSFRVANVTTNKDDKAADSEIEDDKSNNKKRLSKRQLMFHAKDNWVSKKGAKLVKGGIKGGLVGIKSFRNFAVDLKDALKADYMDDWANAINDDDGEEHESADDIIRRSEAEGRAAVPLQYNGEEEKEEIGVIFEEHTDSFTAAEGMEKQASLPSIA